MVCKQLLRPFLGGPLLQFRVNGYYLLHTLDLRAACTRSALENPESPI